MAWRARIALSRPRPGPETRMTTSLRPWDIALRAASWATIWAAYAVDLREPRKLHLPALDHAITDPKGQVIAWSSAGKCNFRGSRKSTAYAAQIVAQDAARNAMSHGLKDVVIRVSGPGLGRDSAIRALQAIGLEITSIVDVTPIPHNGCRPRKRRRV